MDLAAIVISLLSLAVAVWSILLSRRTAAEGERRADTPVIGLSVVPAIGGDYVARLRNDGRLDLDDITVEIITAARHEGMHNIGSLRLFSSTSNPTGPRISVGPLRVGEPRDLALGRSGPYRGGVLRLRFECRRGENVWPPVVAAADLPTHPSVH